MSHRSSFSSALDSLGKTVRAGLGIAGILVVSSRRLGSKARRPDRHRSGQLRRADSRRPGGRDQYGDRRKGVYGD